MGNLLHQNACKWLDDNETRELKMSKKAEEPERSRRFQRSFLGWIHENRARFLVPIGVTKISTKRVRLYLANCPNCISVTLTESEITVWVDWEGEAWDILREWDVGAELTPDGYTCKFCKPEHVKVWPTLYDLRRDHLYEPFLIWVNETLFPARTLQICGSAGATTWAQLVAGGPQGTTSGYPSARIDLPNLVATIQMSTHRE